MILPVAQLLTGSGCREGPPVPGRSEEPSQHPGSSAMSIGHKTQVQKQTIFTVSQCLFISLLVNASIHKIIYIHLDLINEALSNIQSLVWIPQYDFKTLLQTQLPPNSGQPTVGPCCQSQRGDPQQDHVTVVRGTLLGSSEK